MARRAGDLLDIFREGPEPRPTRRRRPARQKSGSSSASRPAFDGVFLAPRQLLLAGCVLCLLLVLSFTIGLAVGRGDDATGPDLQRPTPRWEIVGRVPATDFLTNSPVTEPALRSALIEAHGIPARFVAVEAIPDGFEIRVGPFRDEASAETWLVERDLRRLRVPGGVPFRTPQIRATR